MDDHDLDAALIAAAFDLAVAQGWRRVSAAAAARRAGLPLDRVRARFPGRGAILLRFGRLADQAMLSELPEEPAARERLFDLLMRRFDVLQAHREGVIALLRGLPLNPGAALLLSAATLRSMGWALEAAGIPATGLAGRLRAHGLLAVWLTTVRAWERDDSADLSGTMSALDKALGRADTLAGWLGDGRNAAGEGSPIDDDLPNDDLPDDLRVIDLPPLAEGSASTSTATPASTSTPAVIPTSTSAVDQAISPRPGIQ